MKTFEIKVSGSGTKNQIECRLIEIAREIQTLNENELSERNNVAPFFEDSVLCAEITAE